MAHIKWIKMWLIHRSQLNFKCCLIEYISIRIFQQPGLGLALLSLTISLVEKKQNPLLTKVVHSRESRLVNDERNSSLLIQAHQNYLVCHGQVTCLHFSRAKCVV